MSEGEVPWATATPGKGRVAQGSGRDPDPAGRSPKLAQLHVGAKGGPGGSDADTAGPDSGHDRRGRKDAVELSRRKDLVCREVDGSLVGLDLRSSRYFSLNQTGTFLWGLLEGGSERAVLVDALVEQHHIDPAVAGQDVDAFISSLQEQDLLEG